MNEHYYVNKRDGRRIRITERNVKLLGEGFLKEWTQEGYIPTEVGLKTVTKIEPEKVELKQVELKKVEPIVVEKEEEIEITYEKIEPYRSLSQLKSMVSELTEENLTNLLEDERVSVRMFAENELKKRSNVDTE